MSRINPILLDRSLDFLSDVAVICNRRHDCVYVNAAGARLMGMSPAAAIGKGLRGLFASCPQAEEGLAEVFQHARRAHVEQTIADGVGQVRHFECIYSPVTGHQGNVEFVIGIWREKFA